MRKMLRATGASAIVLALSLTLTGCFGQAENTDTPTDDETSQVTQSLVNPTVMGSETPVASSVVSGLTIYTNFLGAGYPTLAEMEEMQPGQTSTGTLVGESRVVALTFKITNTTKEDKPVSELSLGETKVNGETVSTSTSADSVHAMLGGVNPPDSVTVIKPGESYSWSLDALIPTEVIGSNKVEITQMISYAGTPATANFTLNLDETKKEPTDNGTETEE